MTTIPSPEAGSSFADVIRRELPSAGIVNDPMLGVVRIGMKLGYTLTGESVYAAEVNHAADLLAREVVVKFRETAIHALGLEPIIAERVEAARRIAHEQGRREGIEVERARLTRVIRAGIRRLNKLRDDRRLALEARDAERERCAQIVMSLNAEYREQNGLTAQRGFAVEAAARIRKGDES